MFYLNHEVVLKESSTLEGFFSECLSHSGLRCFLNTSIVQNLSLQLVSLMASISDQVVKVIEYDDLSELVDLSVEDLDTQDNLANSSRQAKLLDIRVNYR